MRTEKTKNAYKTRAAQLIDRAKNEYGGELGEFGIAVWLINHLPTYSKATWRQYRAALVYDFSERLSSTPTPYNANGLNEAISLLKQTPPPVGKPANLKTSAQKQKKIGLRDLQFLFDHIEANNYRHGQSAILWLLAGQLTGLRPCEWEDAWLSAHNELVVLNAKATHGRAHGPQRIINLYALGTQELDVLKSHLQFINEAKQNPGKNGKSGFESYYEGCRCLLYQACRQLWPKRTKFITLYSARHQFAADAKSAGLSREEIAALMGHASIATATQHYGRRSAGHGGIKVQAHTDDVENVKQLNLHRTEPGEAEGMRL